MLIIARNASRQREFGVRMALGARRSTLLRQVLVESGLLVVSGGVLGGSSRWSPRARWPRIRSWR
jgi:predicted lysophospholipase L1 biosynthesis ABC-type transport system permease subunit